MLQNLLLWVRRIENLNLLLAGLTVLLAILAVVVAFQTLAYMRGRDLEVDTRNDWIEIHKAMINLRVQRSLVLSSPRGSYVSGSGPNPLQERINDYTLAAAQLQGQLDRLNDDPLLVELSTFLSKNSQMDQWQTKEYEMQFDEFVHRVALKSRPR